MRLRLTVLLVAPSVAFAFQAEIPKYLPGQALQSRSRPFLILRSSRVETAGDDVLDVTPLEDLEPPPPTKNTRRTQNVQGNFYVSEGCINCGACAWLAPDVFESGLFKSRVHQQPDTQEADNAAVRAMASCPSGSIRTETPLAFVASVLASDEHGFPFPVDAQRLPGVYHLGHHHYESLGAAPYLVARQGGNFMVNVPRFTRKLAEKVAGLGGVEYLVVTSKGLEVGHERWKEAFPELTRVVHRHDAVPEFNAVCEQVLDGAGPWELESLLESSEAAGSEGREEEDGDGVVDLRIVHIPGHTYGSLAVWHQPTTPLTSTTTTTASAEAALFTGASLGVNPRVGGLDGFAGGNKGGLERQARSLRKLVDFPRGQGGGEGSGVEARALTNGMRPWRWLISAFGAPARLGSDAGEEGEGEETASGGDSAEEQVRVMVLEAAERLEKQPRRPLGV